MYVCIYSPARRPATPSPSPPMPSQPTTPLMVTSRLPPSGKISFTVLPCWPRPPMHYLTGCLHAVHYCLLHARTNTYNVLLPIKYLYSSHILATIKITCAIRTC